MKDLSFAKFFNPSKSMGKTEMEYIRQKKEMVGLYGIQQAKVLMFEQYTAN